MGTQISAKARVPGGPWFVQLEQDGGPSVQLGPYENPGLAKDDAQALQKFFEAALRQNDGEEGKARTGGK